MRSLALLLLLMNLSAFIWQLGFFPWLPWQPEQFMPTSSSVHKTNLPTLYLLNETVNKAVTINPKIATATPTTISDTQVIISEEKVNNSFANDDQVEKQPSQESTQKIGLLSQLATQTLSKAVSHEIAALQETTKITTPPATVTNKQTDVVPPVADKVDEQIDTIEAKSYCYDIGPYTKNTTAQQAANWFKTQKALENKVETRETPVLSSTRVYLPPYASRQAAREVEKRLNQQNIADRIIITQGELTNGISLGVYRDQESVERRLKELKEKGYPNVQTEKRYKTDTMYWLSVKIGTVELLDTFKKAQQIPSATSVQCK